MISNSLFVKLKIWEEYLKNKNSIFNHFQYIIDPRKGKNKMYLLTDIIGLTICAVIAGADSWYESEKFGKIKIEWLKKHFNFENGIPSHDTLRRVFSLINPNDFEVCFLNWINSIRKKTKGEIIPIDGKTVRRSHDNKNGKSAIHMVSAWANTNNIVLGQLKTNEKSNEITAIPKLLETLDLNGCIVSIDAMGCQKKIAENIIDNGANYVLAVKDNQENLYNSIQAFFKKDIFNCLNGIDNYKPDEENKHGRSDLRKYWIFKYNKNILGSKLLDEWKNIKSIGMVESERLVKGNYKKERRYYITSLNCKAKRFSKIIRNHWYIENKLHWCLDVAFREDECRKRKGHSAENFTIVRRIALNMIKNEKSITLGVKSRRLIAGWGNEYLEKILGFNP